jgi:hypothetical protein
LKTTGGLTSYPGTGTASDQIRTVPERETSASRGLGEVAAHEGISERARDVLAGDEHAVVDGAGELVDREVDVGIAGQFATPQRAEERCPVALALPGDHLGFEPGRDYRGVLSLAGEGAEDRAGIGGGQERGELAEVIAQVAAEVSVVGSGEELLGVGDEGVEQDVTLGIPPAVDGLLGDPGPGGYALDRQVGEAALGKQVIGRLQDG